MKKFKLFLLFILTGIISVTIIASVNAFNISQENSIISSNHDNQETYGPDFNKPGIVDNTPIPDEPSWSGEKLWYEYIKYSTIAVTNEYSLIGEKYYKFYDPINYVGSTIMTTSPFIPNNGSGGFSTADSLSLSIETTEEISFSKNVSASYSVAIETAYEVNANVTLIPGFLELGGSITVSASEEFGNSIAFEWGKSHSTSVSYERSFSATRRNETGGIIPWRLTQYTVELPIKVDEYVKIDGSYYYTKTFHMTITLLSGVCREWSDGYIEHWSTGEPITLSDFYDKFVTKEKAIEAAKVILQEQN